MCTLEGLAMQETDSELKVGRKALVLYNDASEKVWHERLLG